MLFVRKWRRFAILTASWAATIVVCSSVDLCYAWAIKSEDTTHWTRSVGFATGYFGVVDTASDPGGWHAHLRTPEFSPSPILSAHFSAVHAYLVTPWLLFGIIWLFHVAWTYARRRPRDLR